MLKNYYTILHNCVEGYYVILDNKKPSFEGFLSLLITSIFIRNLLVEANHHTW
jgi:hypothetical protein